MLLFESLIPGVDGAPIAIWTAAGLALIAISLLFAWQGGGTWDVAASNVCLSLGVALAPLAIRHSFTMCMKWADEVAPLTVAPASPREDEAARRARCSVWLDPELQALRRHAAIGGAGGALASLAVIASWRCLTAQPRPERVWSMILTVVTGLFAGIALAHLFILSRLIFRFGKTFPVRIDNHRYGTSSVGALMARCWAWATIIWAIITLSARHQNHSLDPLCLVAIPVALALVATFAVCQLPLHEKMISAKREALEKLHAQIAELQQNLAGIGSAEIDRIAFLEKQIAAIVALPEWPFDWPILAGVASLALSSVAPHAPDLLERGSKVRTIVATFVGH